MAKMVGGYIIMRGLGGSGAPRKLQFLRVNPLRRTFFWTDMERHASVFPVRTDADYVYERIGEGQVISGRCYEYYEVRGKVCVIVPGKPITLPRRRIRRLTRRYLDRGSAK
jgi:hypothetical protein